MKKDARVTRAVLCVAVSVLSSVLLPCIASAQTGPKTAACSKPAALIDVTVSEGTSMSVAKLGFYSQWLARWLACCLPGEETFLDEMLRKISIRARS